MGKLDRNRVPSREEAKAALSQLLASVFGKADREHATFRVPVGDTDADMVLSRFIRGAERQAYLRGVREGLRAVVPNLDSIRGIRNAGWGIACFLLWAKAGRTG